MIEIVRKSKKKRILEYLKRRFNFTKKLDFVFFQDSKGRIRVASKDFLKLKTEGMRIENLGLYFGRWDGSELRLSIEGSQIVGRDAKKNVLNLDDEKALEWMSGRNIEVKARVENGFVILKHNKDFLGSGRFLDGKVVSFIPKERRIKPRN